jgi:hypothetical protein
MLVLGDTNSAFAAVLAERMQIPVYHMEAGNRSFDANVPEELNRKIIDHASSFNLPYTQHAKRNLLAEGLDLNRICVPDPIMLSMLENSLPDLNFTQFYSRILPGTFPTKCETLLETSYFIPPPNQLNITSTFSVESFQPVISGPILT